MDYYDIAIASINDAFHSILMINILIGYKNLSDNYRQSVLLAGTQIIIVTTPI